MNFFIITILFASICFGIRPDYFQQHVAYDIEVTLDDSAHTLQAFEKILRPPFNYHAPLSKLG